MSGRAGKYHGREGELVEGPQVVGGSDRFLHYGHTNGVAGLFAATADDAADEREIIARADASRRDAEDFAGAANAQGRGAWRDSRTDSLSPGTDKRALVRSETMRHLTLLINAVTDGLLLAMFVSGVRGILPFLWVPFK